MIPNHKLRLNAFVGLIITNVICTFFLTFHPFDIVFLEEIIIWANTIDPEYNEILVSMREECANWMDKIDDKGVINERDLIELFYPNRKAKQTLSPNIEISESRF